MLPVPSGCASDYLTTVNFATSVTASCICARDNAIICVYDCPSTHKSPV